MRLLAPRLRTRAFTLVELLIVMAVIGILVALLMPVLGSARESARATACQNNLRQIGAAFTRSSGNIPSDHLKAAMLPQTLTNSLGGNANLWICPNGVGETMAYGFNGRSHRLLNGDGGKILAVEYHKPVADVIGSPPTDNWAIQSAARHRNSTNMVTFGGAVATRTIDAIDPNSCTNQETLWRPLLDSAFVIGGGCATTVH
ncbi:MAG: type II secretion system GspH family protein [Planctomycetia bacterium]|nr:type II secretion system GspH family protein [Planctomycetia bacterium]